MPAVPHLDVNGSAAVARTRRAAPRLALLQTVGGWGLYDACDRPVFEAEGPGARRACLMHALQLGVVCLRAGEEMSRRPSRRGRRST